MVHLQGMRKPPSETRVTEVIDDMAKDITCFHMDLDKKNVTRVAISLEENRDALSRVPSLPGVYRYYDNKGTCLYVGKARDLKRRVSSYFRGRGLSPRIAIMVNQIASFETTVVRSEAEALLLENNLIKTLKPKYNILFRDDKSYPYLKISADTYPRVSYYRGAVDTRNRYFGPYPNANAVRDAIGILQRVFHLRTCESAVFRNRSRACLMGQMGRCSSPCVGSISQEEYASDIRDACRFLDGETNSILDALGVRMREASDALRYEEAAVFRDRIASLSSVMHSQSVETRGDTSVNADIIAVAFQEGVVCVNLAMVRSGRHLGDHAYFPTVSVDTLVETDSSEILEVFLSEHYAQCPVPDCVVSDASNEREEIEELLGSIAGRAVSFLHAPETLKRQWLRMAKEGASIALSRRISEIGGEKRRASDLVSVLALDLENLEDLRIECFDISHTSGEATQASCVVFAGLEMASNRYRRFNIETAAPGDDYAAMREVLSRRYASVARGEAELPSIVLVDGGKGQVSVARAVFQSLGLPLSVIVGIAKGEGRKTGLETLIFADGRLPKTLGSESPALMLLAMVRDEAHRFAITGMRTKRSRVRERSLLEDIEGIGPKRREQLLLHFGGMKALKNVSVDDIAKIDGFSRKLATSVYRHLHGVPSDS